MVLVKLKSYPYKYTLPETNSKSSKNRPKPKRTYSNHPFSGASRELLVPGRVPFFTIRCMAAQSVQTMRCQVHEIPC